MGVSWLHLAPARGLASRQFQQGVLGYAALRTSKVSTLLTITVLIQSTEAVTSAGVVARSEYLPRGFLFEREGEFCIAISWSESTLSS